MQRRIVGLSLGLMLFFAITTGVLQYLRSSRNLMRVAVDRLEAIAVTAARGLDGDAHNELNRCMNKTCPNYAKLANFLRDVQEGNNLSTEIYTLARVGERTRFVVRTRHESDFGLAYDLRPEMLPVFEEGKTVRTDVYSDRYGSWLSAYAPVRDGHGAVVALLEADYRAEELYGMLRRDALSSLVVWLLGVGVTGFLSWRLSRQLTVPLGELTRAVDATASGDEGRPLPLDAADEVGLLARRFGVMREAVAQARARERLALIGQMAGSMVHDLRGPLTVAMGMTELMQEEERAADRRELGARVMESIRRIEAMARDVLDFSRGDSRPNRTRFRAASLLEEVSAELEEFGAEKGVLLKTAPAWEGLVWADRDKLQRLLYNLAKNAIEATPKGRAVAVHLRSYGDRWTMSVEDEGPGLPPQLGSRLFEPFATHGKKGGTGLGLAIVKSIAESHGGSVTHTARPSGGTIFTVELPIDRSESQIQQAEAAVSQAA